MAQHLRNSESQSKDDLTDEATYDQTRPRTTKPRQVLTQAEETLRRQIDNLQAAAGEASAHTRNLYLFFLSFGLYLAIIFGSTTHEQLLRETPVTLPLFNVELPLKGFYWVAPALLVLLHFNLLVQCYLLAGKLRRFEDAIQELSDSGTRAVERARLNVFPFTQMLIGDHRSLLGVVLPAIMAWTTIVVGPIALLLFGQASFLPYHDPLMTWSHRCFILFDVFLLLLLWPIAIDIGGQWGRHLRSAPRCGFDQIVRQNLNSAKVSIQNSAIPIISAILIGLGALVGIASCLVLTIPGEFLARSLDRLVGEQAALGILPRNLVVRETNLVESCQQRHRSSNWVRATRGRPSAVRLICAPAICATPISPNRPLFAAICARLISTARASTRPISRTHCSHART
jgi:hypothetical protein